MKPINICVPVLKRYDLLRELIASIDVPATVVIIDNGQNLKEMSDISTRLAKAHLGYWLHTPIEPLSVAASWNWFLKNIPEERLITNDDIVFAKGSINKMIESTADLVWAEGIGFSCFVIRDSCVSTIGLFDETISPGYAYYEDEDYLQRIDGKGTKPARISLANVKSGITHERSSTLQVSTDAEMAEHHRKFKIAQRNYMKKWGLTIL